MMALSKRWAMRILDWQAAKQEWLTAARLIQSEEKEKVGRFVFKEDALRSMCGRLLLRKAVCDVLHLPWNSFQLARSDKGKPYLVEDDTVRNRCAEMRVDGLHLNVSHAGDYVVLASEVDRAVGIDVMDFEPFRQPTAEYFELMDRQFAISEWDSIQAPRSDEDKMRQFYRFWSLKESYIKAVGVGLSVDLRNIVFRQNPALSLETRKLLPGASVTVQGQPLDDWQFYQSHLDDHHCVSVAVQSPQEDLGSEQEFEIITFDDIVSSAGGLFLLEEDQAYWETFHGRKFKHPPARR